MKQLDLVRTIFLAGSLLLQLNPLCFHSRGAAGDVDLSFDPGSGITGPASWDISALRVLPNGQVLIGGSFTYFDGTNPNGRARLNADGSLDGTFVPSSFYPTNIGVIGSDIGDRVVTAAAGQSDGKVLIAGYTIHWDCDPESCNRWAIYFLNRVTADGNLDANFFYPSAENYSADWDNHAIKSIIVQSDGKVLIGHSFTLNGTNFGEVQRLNSNGSLDGTGVTPSYYSTVECVVVQPDGKTLIGGYFTNVNGASRNGIARLNADGSLDDNFNPGTGAPGGALTSIALQPDGKVLIGGSFTNFNGTSRHHLARLNANGSLDSNFNPGTGPNAAVTSIALQPDGQVLIGGGFTTINGVARRFVARLYGDPAPSLNIARSNGLMILSWPESGLNFQLQESTDTTLPNSWSPVAQPALTNAGQISVAVPTSAGGKFFRLKSP